MSVSSSFRSYTCSLIARYWETLSELKSDKSTLCDEAKGLEVV